MRWVKDRTGRFAHRPHYLPEELDSECEKLINDFLHERHGKVVYPISTEDLTVLIEKLTDDLDLYADLSNEGTDVEGVTDFFPGRLPKVRISGHLTLGSRTGNRLRTTLTHELGHVKFHAFMFDKQAEGALFGPPAAPASNKCKRENILRAPKVDWMEWQAGFACGALLMPAAALRTTIRQFLTGRRISVPRLQARSEEGLSLIAKVSGAYEVSGDAARVRLLQRGTLTEAPLAATLF